MFGKQTEFVPLETVLGRIDINHLFLLYIKDKNTGI